MKKVVKIKSFPAMNGESFLISIGSSHILIDAGYSDTYHDYIKNELKEINKRGEKLDLFILTHIDTDHIEGAKELLIGNISNDKSEIVKINEIWFNSFYNSELTDKISKELERIDIELIQTIVNREANSKTIYKPNEGSLVGIGEAISVTNLVLEGNYNWNCVTKQKAICIENVMDGYTIGDEKDIKIHILSPYKRNLTRLDNWWVEKIDQENSDLKLDHSELVNSLYELLIQNYAENIYEDEIGRLLSCEINDIESLSKEKVKYDTSKANASSIAVLIEYQDIKMIFLADSIPAVINKSLKRFTSSDKLKCDLLKLSHHGSKRNISDSILSKLNCTNFLISTNGSSFDHPDPMTLAKLIQHNEYGDITIYLNQQNTSFIVNEYIDFLTKEKLKKGYKYNIEILNGKDIEL